jgi:Icc-related predicted phosphoesterase
MKILCVADHVDPLVYSPQIKQRFAGVDMVLSAGDLPLTYYDFIVSNLNKPLLFVFGNHNLGSIGVYRRSGDSFKDLEAQGADSMDAYVGARYINRKAVREKGLIVAGFGGSLLYSHGENQFSDIRMYVRVLSLLPRLLLNRLLHGRYLDILLTHAPPLGVNDRPDRCHTGFKAFRWFVRVFRPAYHVHGHVHLYDRNQPREQRYCGTRVINAYDHCILEVEPPGSRAPRGVSGARTAP